MFSKFISNDSDEFTEMLSNTQQTPQAQGVLQAATMDEYTYVYTYIHTLHYTTLHYTTVQCIALHYIAVQYITLHYINLNRITSHNMTLHGIT